MEDLQQRDFDICFDGHIILNCVQSSKDKVEDANSIPQFWRESLYHHSKAAAYLAMSKS